MADHVVAHNAEPKFSRKRKLGKNKKKSWRAVDIIETEEFLEDERFQLRTTGLVAEKTDNQLFVVDKNKSDSAADIDVTGQTRRRQPKPLKCFSNLVNTSKIPCPRIDDMRTELRKLSPSALARTELRKLSPSALVAEGKKATSFSRHQVTKQCREAQEKKAAELKNKNSLPVFNCDLWEGDEQDEADEFYLEVTKKKRVKAPMKPSPTAQTAVVPPHPGASYNPSYDDHQDLLLQAHMMEMKKEKGEQRIHNALDAKFPSLAEAPTEATWLQEMSGGLFADEEDDGLEANAEAADEGISVNPPVSGDQRKTKREKRKVQEAKEMRQKLLREKEKKVRENMVLRIPTLRSQLNKELKEMARMAEVRARKREDKKSGTKRLGKTKYVDPDLELKLSSELVGSLRHLKPEGHLLEDRYKSLQKRNIIEPRNRVRRKKVKKKTFEKKSHKNVV